MSLAESLKMELSMEIATTKRHFNNLTENHFDYKPHEKSMTLGVLAAHTVETIGWAKEIIGQDVFVLDMENYSPPVAENKEDLIELTDSCLAVAMDVLNGLSDEELFKPWKMMVGDKTVMDGVPKIAVFRSFILNHMIHHRGQLTVYMRLCDIPVPKTYGPSADDAEMDFID